MDVNEKKNNNKKMIEGKDHTIGHCDSLSVFRYKEQNVSFALAGTQIC